MSALRFHSLHQAACHLEVMHRLSARAYATMAGLRPEGHVGYLCRYLAGRESRLAELVARLEQGMEDRPLAVACEDAGWRDPVVSLPDGACGDVERLLDLAAHQQRYAQDIVRALLDSGTDPEVRCFARRVALAYRAELVRMAADVNALHARR